jgi:hypothetical protein
MRTIASADTAWLARLISSRRQSPIGFVSWSTISNGGVETPWSETGEPKKRTPAPDALIRPRER